MLRRWLSQLDKGLTKQWRLESLRVLAQSVLAKLAARLRLLKKRRRRRRGSFGDCHAWTRMQVLLLRLVMKCQQRSFLRLIPMVASMPKLNPMGVIVLKLIPMGPEVEPNGCDHPEVDPNGCDRAPAVVRIFDEDDEEEEAVPLIRKNSRHYRGSKGDSDIPSPDLVSLQEPSISDFDQALEEVIPEDMLSEPIADDMMVVCSEIPDVGLEVTRAVSRASSTLEGSLQCQDVGLICPTHMEVTEDPSALEVAVVENPAPEDGAGSYPALEGVAGSDLALVGSASCNPALEGVVGSDPALVGGASCNLAPEGVQVSSPSHISMDVHVGLSPPRSDGATAMHASMASNKQVA
jgi:hypothetical protein